MLGLLERTGARDDLRLRLVFRSNGQQWGSKEDRVFVHSMQSYWK
jgi:hypothetical protein